MCVLETSNDPICLFWCLGQKTFLEGQQPMSVQITITEHSDPGALASDFNKILQKCDINDEYKTLK